VIDYCFYHFGLCGPVAPARQRGIAMDQDALLSQRIQWTSDLSVGIRQLDNDHRGLFDVVEGLRFCIQQGITLQDLRRLSKQLMDYANIHFLREEAIMAEYDYDKLAEHRVRHQEFMTTVYAIRRVLTDRPERIEPRKLLRYLTDWLQFHIRGEDMQYAAALNHPRYGNRRSDFTMPLPAEQAEPDDRQANKRVSVSLEVPSRYLDALQLCAKILADGGEQAKELATTIKATNFIDLEEAEKIVAALQR
jgi:hemerythrin